MAQQPLPSSVQPTTDMYGGDEVSALVLDPGYSTTRAGYAGEDRPKQVVPSFYGKINYDNGTRDIFGDEVIYPRANFERPNYMNRDSVVEDWDAATRLWEHVLIKRLQPARATPAIRNGLNDRGKNDENGDVDMGEGIEEQEEGEKPLAESPLLVTEAPWNTTKNREKAIEIAMESWGAPAFWLNKTPVLAAFAAGKSTALVVDVGCANASVVAVHDGMVLKRSIQRSPVAGSWLSGQIRSMWDSSDPKVEVVPTFMVENKKPVEAGQPAEARLKKFDFVVPESFRAFEEERLLTEFKESVVEVWRGPGKFQGPNEDFVKSQVGRVFEMPDGYNQMWREQRFKVAEGMWDETAAYPPLGGGEEGRVQKGQTIPALIKASLEGVDADLRANLVGNIVVTGASTLLNGFNDRLHMELTAMYPGLRIKIHAAGLSSERRFGAWIGGSILASLGTFHQMWISKKEYEENGAGIVEKRCK
ncbi:actin family [Rhypophila decipiens]|uniref:Actin-related protein 4 n=1 Tax=Rhypophila decipiens TaxID=261697 RepID=A0AAN7BD04_9PEZI|nr:actin family [Rhypophila decipiens]